VLPPQIAEVHLQDVHVPGKALITADTLSRAPIKCTLTEEEQYREGEVQVSITAVKDSLPSSQTKLQQIAEDNNETPPADR
jgi:hypothetical protein